jgi:hypothetical protein
LAQPLVLSASSVNTYLRCGEQWRLAYVVGVKSPPNLKAVRGIAVHKAVEVDMSQKMSSGVDLPVSDMLDAYSDSWDEESANGFMPDPMVTPGEIKDGGVKLIKLYHRQVAPTITPIAVELPLQFDINGQTYTGQIDLLAEEVVGDQPIRTVIRDTKTTGRKPQGQNYLLNMTGYALGVRQQGIEEADTVLDYLVATNKPYYHEIRMGGPISDDDIRRFAGVVESVGDAINAGTFTPNGLVSGACSWCGFKAICKAYKEA